jgi:glucosamine--fructose-6-phosphate aminotransferase (isomerizing)
MCGIIGIISKGSKDIPSSLVGALTRLEYRGYDSAGVAVVSQGTIHTLKCVGAPSQYLKGGTLTDLQKKREYIRIGIGHNRWATHGKPTLENAHPHIDGEERFAVVHNGTILNYEALRKKLIKSGTVFTSDTDTEVIPHLVASFVKKGLSTEEAFSRTLDELEGAYGIVLIDKRDENTLYVARQGSPIVIGSTDDTYYVASSIHGFLPYTNRYITLEDGEVAVLSVTPSLMCTIRSRGSKQEVGEKEEQIAEGTTIDDLSKGDFETFMQKEIYEQPTTTRATLLGRIDEKRGTAVLGGLIDHASIIEQASNILVTGCGTAYNAGEVGAYIIEQLTPLTVRTEIASEGRYKTLRLPREKTIVIAISQSGETADTLEYIKELKQKHYETFGIVNVVGSALALLAGKGVYTSAGAEIGVASTKAFTAQLSVMYLFALYIARSRDMDIRRGVSFARELDAIPELMKQTLVCDASIQKLAKKYASYRTIQFLGRGVHVPIAKEAALKFKELTYIESGAYPLGELKHGPIAIIDEDTLSVVIAPRDEFFDLVVNSIEQIKSKGGKVLLVTDEDTKDHPIVAKVDDTVFIPTIKEELLYPFLEIIPLQLFAYHTASILGKNIDKPRNLAKSVTVQ